MTDLLRRFWRWLNKPRPPDCTADRMIFGQGQDDDYTHGGSDCPIHGPWPQCDDFIEVGTERGDHE